MGDLASPDQLLRRAKIRPIPAPDESPSSTDCSWTVDDDNRPRPTYKAFSDGKGNISTASQALCTTHEISHEDVAADRNKYALVTGDLDAVRRTRTDSSGTSLVKVWETPHERDAAGKAHCDVASDEMREVAPSDPDCEKESPAFQKRRKHLAKDLANKMTWTWIFAPPDDHVADIVKLRGIPS